MAEQRERLLAATAAVAARDATPTVAAVVGVAGVGRNTFYEYFDDANHAVGAARAAAVRRIDEVLREAEETARTPIERWRSLARAWLTFSETEPNATLLAIERTGAAGALGAASKAFEAALSRSLETLRQAGVSPPVDVADRLLAAAAAGEAFARAVASAALPLEGAPASADLASTRARLERSLVDVLVRLLR